MYLFNLDFLKKINFYKLTFIIFFLLTIFLAYRLFVQFNEKNYRYINGRELILNFAKLQQKFFLKNNRWDFSLENIESIRESNDLSKDETFFIDYFYFIHNPKLSLEERVAFFAKSSIDRGLTDDSRAASTYQILELILANKDDYERIVSTLKQTNPYPGLLTGINTYQEYVQTINQFCYDTYKKSPCASYLLLFESGVYNFLLEKNLKQKYENDFKTIINSLKNLKSLHSEEIVNLNNQKILSFLVYFNGLLAVEKIGLVQENDQIEKLALVLPAIENQNSLRPTEGKPEIFLRYDANVKSYLYFSYANYYLYKKDFTKAKENIKKLNEMKESGAEIFVLFENTNFLEKDKQRFRTIDPNFLK